MSDNKNVDPETARDEQYVDPNSGAAPQPGGYFTVQDEPVVLFDELRPEGTSDSKSDESEENDGEYDPSDHTVEEVKAYVEENPDEREAVLAAEKDGKNRTSLVSALESDDDE